MLDIIYRFYRFILNNLLKLFVDMLNIEDNFHPVEKYYCTVWYSNFGSPFIRTFVIKVSLDEDLNEKTVRQKICDLIDETEEDEYLKNATKPGVTDTIVAWSKIR